MIYAVAILVILGMAFNKLSREYAFNKLTYYREVTKSSVEIGEAFEVISIIENKKIIPITFLQVVEKLPTCFKFMHRADLNSTSEVISHKITLSLMPYQRIKRRYTVSCDRRGRHVIHDCTLYAGDLLGLNTFSKGVSEEHEVIVLPKSYDIEEGLTSHGNYNGNVSVKRWIIEDPVLTIGIREYTGFEPQKNIHWPSSLKNSRLMVKNFDYTTDNRVMVALNIESVKPFWARIEQGRIEDCISISRRVLEDFEENGIQYGFTTNAQSNGGSGGVMNIPPGWGNNHLFNIIECLGRIDYGISMEFEELLERFLKRSESFTTYVIITPRIMESYIDYINGLNKICERLVVISLDEENLSALDRGIITCVERRDNQ